MLYEVAITLIPGVGGILGRKLISHFGGVEELFRQPPRQLSRIPGIGENLAKEFSNPVWLREAEKELNFTEKNNIRVFFYTDKDYPGRLKHCPDAPLLLFFRGNTSFSQSCSVGVVGTRRPTEYGREVTRKIVMELKEVGPAVVSGLAYGIDTVAHRAAAESGLDTVAVLAHGLDMVYPAQNRFLAEMMAEKGGLLTELPSGTALHRDLFPKRNRIIAGLVDALVVVESAEKGGALITADIAFSYQRDVFAVPGRIDSRTSSGPHRLIKQNKAALVESGKDILEAMNWWPMDKDRGGVQGKLFINLSESEKRIIDILRENKEMHFDELFQATMFSPGKLNSGLLKLEFEGLIRVMPGKLYRLS